MRATIFQSVFPAPAFAGVKALIHQATGADWAELAGRIPARLED